MKYRYSRYVEDLLDSIDLESLVSQLSDLLLASGFDNPWDPQSDEDQTMQALHDAILDALLNGGVMSEEMLDRLTGPQAGEHTRDQLEQLVQRLIEKLSQEGYVSLAGQPGEQRLQGPGSMAPTGRRTSRSPTKPSTFSATGRSATCSGRWAAAAPAATTRASRRPASRPAAHRARTNSATR